MENFNFFSENAGEGAECSWAPSADPELCVIAWAEMESVRGPWADCKGARFPGPDGNISAPPWVKDECLPCSWGDGGKVPRVGKADVEDSMSSLTWGKGPKVVSVYIVPSPISLWDLPKVLDSFRWMTETFA